MSRSGRRPTGQAKARTTTGSHYDSLYQETGFGYERQRAMWRRWVRRHYIRSFALKRGERLLDIPCGDGFWASLFSRQGFRVSGVDISEGGIEAARRRYPGSTSGWAMEGPLPYASGGRRTAGGIRSGSLLDPEAIARRARRLLRS